MGGSVVGTGGGAAKTGGYFQLSVAGSVSKISAYIRGYGLAKAAIYSDLNGGPGLLVGGVTAQVSVPSTAGWVDFVYSSPVSLQSGGYWLTLIYDSGCNWFYSSGGVSAWNWITYCNEPASSFGSHTDRSDSISIYATYTAGSTTPTQTAPPSSGSSSVGISVKKACLAYSALSDADTTFLATNFNLVVLHPDFLSMKSTQAQAIHAKNPSTIVLAYRELFTLYKNNNDWAEANQHEDWFLHDIYGNRIVFAAFGWYLMDPGSAGWRAHFVSNLNSVVLPGYDGVFLDDVWNNLRTYGYTTSSSNIKSSDISRWHSDVLGMIQYVKANIGGKRVVLNTDQFDTFDYASNADGVFIEPYAHATWESSSYYSTGMLPQAIANLYTVSGMGKIAISICGVSDTPNSQLVKYCYTMSLIGANGNQAYWLFNDWKSSDGSHGFYSIMNTNVGSPVGSYYMSQNVYMRDFTLGKVLSNPTSNSVTINLGASYKTSEWNNRIQRDPSRLHWRNTIIRIAVRQTVGFFLLLHFLIPE